MSRWAVAGAGLVTLAVIVSIAVTPRLIWLAIPAIFLGIQGLKPHPTRRRHPATKPLALVAVWGGFLVLMAPILLLILWFGYQAILFLAAG